MNHSKKILFVFALLACYCISNAQFHLGVKVGTNLTKIDGKSFNEEFKFNYLAGAFAEIGAGKKFSVNPELLFSQTTATVSDNYNDPLHPFSTSQTKAKLNYLSIPILLDYKLAGPLHLQAGPQFSIATSKDKTLLQEGGDAFTSGDFSFVAGIQLKVMKFRVSGRYVAGMSNINDINKSEKWKSQAIQVAVGFAIF
ncbi:porin family protein [Niabella soli]|uniref:Membrane protein n=1 Tax=Niabella soli DSM 19437 TaxID=929713 RepID=W0F2J7_9BACT|nr:porin family protein [Niabella soli]AHF15694.1 membrane protein [Niabella soli DSM 19437]